MLAHDFGLGGMRSLHGRADGLVHVGARQALELALVDGVWRAPPGEVPQHARARRVSTQCSSSSAQQDGRSALHELVIDQQSTLERAGRSAGV